MGKAIKEHLFSSDFSMNESYSSADATAFQKACSYSVPANQAIQLVTDRALNMQFPAKEAFANAAQVTDIGNLVQGKFFYSAASKVFAFKPLVPFKTGSLMTTECRVFNADGDLVRICPYDADNTSNSDTVIYFDASEYVDTDGGWDITHTIAVWYLPFKGMVRFQLATPTSDVNASNIVILEQSVAQFNNHTHFSASEIMRLNKSFNLIDYFTIEIYVKASWLLDLEGDLDIFQIPIIRQQITAADRRSLRPIVMGQFVDV